MSDQGSGEEPDQPEVVVDPVFVGMRRSLSVLTTLAVMVAFYFGKDLVLPVLLGFLIALTLSPVTRFFKRLGIPHAITGGVLIFMTAATVASVVVFSAGTVNSWVADAPEMGQQLQGKLAGIFQTLEDVRDASEEVELITEGDTATPVQEVVIRQPSLLNNAVSAATGTITTIVVALVLASFLLASGDMFYIKLVQSFKSLAGKKRALTTVYDIERKVSRYLLTITIINACLGFAVAMYLWALGLDYFYIWGFAAFLLNFVPFIGGLVGTVLVGATAIVQFDSVYYALAAPLGYQFLTSIEGQFITPTLVGRRLEMNAVAVFLTVVVWGWLWGIPGALVAVPFLVVFKTICENFAGLETLANFLSKSQDAAEKRQAAKSASTEQAQ